MAEEMNVGKFPSDLRVLAVDDDCTGLRVLKAQLKHCNYHNVTTATNAATALEMLRERKGRNDQFDLVISDIFMAEGGIDGFKLLEHISLEMDIPVILMSANDEKKIMMKGVMHGACDYLVKPARLEQIRNIWMHVARKSVNDKRNKISASIDAAGVQKLPGDAENGECSNHTRKHSKNKKDSNGAEEDKDGTSTQKKPRVQWSGELHRKFLEAIDQIGLNKVVPKKIHEVMNVDGLSRDSVGSHLQKYRLYLKKLNEGTLKHSNPLMDEQQEAWLSGSLPANRSMSVHAESSQHQKEIGIHEAPPPLVGASSSSSNPLARMKSPFALGTHSVLPTQSDQHMSTHRNLGIPLQQGTRSCTSYASILRGKMLDANRGIPFDADNFLEEIANCEMSAPSSHLPLRSLELANRPSVQQIQSSSAGQFSQVAPSIYLPLQSPELVNQPTNQIMSSSADLFNPVVEPHQIAGLSNSSSSWGTGVPSRFPNIGHISGPSIGSTHGNNISINQISGLVASSSQVPTFGNEYQNQMAGLMGTTAPMIDLSEQVAVTPFNSRSGASSTMMQVGNTAMGSFSNINQTDNYVIPTQMSNGGVTTGNLREGGTADQQYVGDQVNNNNELLAGTNKGQNGLIDGMDDAFDDWMFF